MRRAKRLIYWFAYRAALCYWFLFRPTARGAYVAVWYGNELLLIQNSYKHGLTLPSGGIKKNETSISAAIRELAEEVGIRATEDELTLIQEFKSTDEGKIDLSVVFELRLDQRPSITVDNVEVVRAEFVSFPDVASKDLTSIARQYVEFVSSPGETDSRQDKKDLS